MVARSFSGYLLPRLITVITLVALSACTEGATSSSLAASQNDFANERYPIQIVNRNKFDKRFWPSIVETPFDMAPGTVVVDTRNRLLYLIEEGGKSRRYGIAVGAAGKSWTGTARVGRKAQWPEWYPTDEMRSITPGLPARIASGPQNPLGARALYLFQNGRDTLYRIHGTSEPWTIGTEVSSGCIRMIDEDVIDLYDRVPKGARVVVL